MGYEDRDDMTAEEIAKLNKTVAIPSAPQPEKNTLLYIGDTENSGVSLWIQDEITNFPSVLGKLNYGNLITHIPYVTTTRYETGQMRGAGLLKYPQIIYRIGLQFNVVLSDTDLSLWRMYKASVYSRHGIWLTNNIK